jgi:hypothetical protein
MKKIKLSDWLMFCALYVLGDKIEKAFNFKQQPLTKWLHGMKKGEEIPA